MKSNQKAVINKWFERCDEHINRKARKKRVFIKIAEYLILTVIGIYLVFPFYLMFVRSFMKIDDIYSAKLWPTYWTIKNYVALFTENNYLLYFWNTIKILFFNIIVVPISASLCAYSFAKIRWKGRELVFAAVLSTIMIPGTVTQIPLYSLFYSLNWIGTPLPLMIPAMFGGGAINIFLLRQFMRNISKEIEEAAVIDGAGMLRRFLTIIIPLCGPILLYIAVGVFSSVWSDFYSPLIYLVGKPEKYTLAVAIYQDSLINGNLVTSNLKMAAGMFMAVFPILVFVIYQRKLVDGIMVGAIKG